MPEYFPALDGLRAVCVAMVMSNHIPAGIVRPRWMYGWLGVDVFFVLSGFLITILLIRERGRTGGISLRGFYVRRFCRIVPLYLCTVLLYDVAVHATGDAGKIAQFGHALPWLLTFMEEYRPAAAGDLMGHAWTLGIEEKFYLVWPVALIGLLPLGRRSLLGLGLSCVVVLGLGEPFSRAYGGLLIGALAAFGLSSPACRSAVEWLQALPEWCRGALVLAAYAAGGANAALLPLFSLSLALSLPSLATDAGRLTRLLANPVLVYIGRRSYGMYLIHVLAMNLVGRCVPFPVPGRWYVVLPLGYAASLAGAALLHVLIERPCIDYGRALVRRFPAPRPVAARPEALTEPHTT